MDFTVFKTRVKISPLYFAVLTAFLLADREKIAFAAICFSLFHELCHFAVLVVFKKAPQEIDVSAAGISMCLNQMSTAQRIAVFSAGAVGNFVLAAVFAAAEKSLFCAINLVIGIFTLLPLCSTDGGSIAAALAESFFPEQAKMLCHIIFTAFGLMAAVLLFSAAIVYKNPYLLIAVFYAVICLLKY